MDDYDMTDPSRTDKTGKTPRRHAMLDYLITDIRRKLLSASCHIARLLTLLAYRCPLLPRIFTARCDFCNDPIRLDHAVIEPNGQIICAYCLFDPQAAEALEADDMTDPYWDEADDETWKTEDNRHERDDEDDDRRTLYGEQLPEEPLW